MIYLLVAVQCLKNCDGKVSTCERKCIQLTVLHNHQSYSQKRTGRSRADSKGGSGGGGHRNFDPGDSDHQGRGSDETLGSSARTRDASLSAVDQQNTGTSRGHVANNSK